ncbi:hypothetical protein [Bryobacter aggregatus]|uniref:hypothetical protein n=1 Tax=Bryobacter aggregatus TaxID=360054 RepID=UPI0004E15140|nr:hypothetical protein [Bryobacter aggregatus]
MLRFFPTLALLLITTVLSGTQCLKLCSLLPVAAPVQKAAPSGHEMPCHQKKTPEPSQMPDESACSHRELVAESQPGALSLDGFPGALFLPLHQVAELALASAGLLIPASSGDSPPGTPSRFLSVLRI